MIAKRQLKKRVLRPTQQLQIEYWAAVGARLEDSNSFLKSPAPQPQYSITFPIGSTGSGIRTLCSIGKRYVGLEIYVNSKIYYERIHKFKNVIEKGMNHSLEWNSDKIQSTIKLTHPHYDPNDRPTWQKQHYWLIEQLESFHKAFSPIFKKL